MIDRDLWSAEELEIFEITNYKCLRCNQPADVLHELTPKSKAPRTWRKPDNRIPLDFRCHEWAHRVGSKISKPILTELWAERIKDVNGRSIFTGI